MRFVKGLLVLLVGALSAAYLANVGAGVIELIPDNIPVIGNIDEVGVVILFLKCLSYFGIDPFRLKTSN